MRSIKLLCTIILFAVCKSGYAQAIKKSPFHLFNPVPKSLMHDMETDRPDVTESPYSVDAGHFQYEADLLKFKRKKDEISSQDTWLVNQANIKLGITRSTDLQLVIQTFGKKIEVNPGSDEQTTKRGIGDVTLRLKQRITGNDGDDFAMAVLPYLKFPTSHFEDQERYEGGLIIPMQLKLSNEWKLGFQIEGDRLQDEGDQHLHTELLQSITLSHELLKGLEGIAETYYTYDFKQHHWANFLNAAMEVSLSHNFKIDAGLNYGVQSDAGRTYFMGTSIRF